MFLFAHGRLSASRKGPGTKPPQPFGCPDVPELRLLENGREDRTPVRAVRGRPSGRQGRTVCQFRCRLPSRQQHGYRSVDITRPRAGRGDWPSQQDAVPPTQHDSAEGAALADTSFWITTPPRWSSVKDTFLLESLILAQDERWRRASYMQVERGPWELAPRRPSGDRVRNT